jgi:hypothetical protein
MTMQCEQVHYHEGDSSSLQSMFQVTFFVLHPTHVSEPPDKNLDNCLTFRDEFIMIKASMKRGGRGRKKKEYCFHS